MYAPLPYKQSSPHLLLVVHILILLQIPVPKTMVVGIDVYHDTAPGGRRSVAGIIASTNANFTKYYSRVTIQSQVRFRFQTDEGLALLLDARHVRVRAWCVGYHAARKGNHRWARAVHGGCPQALLQSEQLPARAYHHLSRRRR